MPNIYQLMLLMEMDPRSVLISKVSLNIPRSISPTTSRRCLREEPGLDELLCRLYVYTFTNANNPFAVFALLDTLGTLLAVLATTSC